MLMLGLSSSTSADQPAAIQFKVSCKRTNRRRQNQTTDPPISEQTASEPQVWNVSEASVVCFILQGSPVTKSELMLCEVLLRLHAIGFTSETRSAAPCWSGVNSADSIRCCIRLFIWHKLQKQARNWVQSSGSVCGIGIQTFNLSSFQETKVHPFSFIPMMKDEEWFRWMSLFPRLFVYCILQLWHSL